MQSVNYYDVLGVSPTADDFVIKAAYKAMAQRYHPDKFHGNTRDAADAEVKMRQINEAYQVLSDPAQRRAYDASFQQDKQQNQQNSQQKSEQAKQQEDWAIALRFYPDLTDLETRLGKIDPSLIPEFRSTLLASQQYEQRQRVANQLEQSYLEDYFGNDALIVDFALELLLAGKRDGAKELNRMVKVVGAGVPFTKIIEQIEAEYFPQRKVDREEKERIRKEEVAAERARLRQRAEEQAKKDAVFNKALFKFILIAGIVLALVIYFVQEDRVEKNRLEAESIAEEKRLLAEKERKDAQSYHNNQDGTVTDIKTGLQWKRCAEGQTWASNSCSGEAEKYSGDAAVTLTSNFAGITDWRLPTKDELLSIRYCSKGVSGNLCSDGSSKPTINTQVFVNSPQSSFWTSDPADNGLSAWGVHFYNGNEVIYSVRKEYLSHVRLVRGGKKKL